MIKNFSSYLFEQSESYNNRILYFQTDFRSMFGDFKPKCLKSAKTLQKLGVTPGKRVLLLLTDMVESSGVFHALVHLGAEIVFVHHQTDIRDVEKICERLHCDIALSDNPKLSQLPAVIVPEVIGLRDVVDLRHGSLESVYEYQADDVVVQYVIQGRDGEFHPTNFTHQDFCDAIEMIDQLGIPPTSRVLSTVNISHPLGTMITLIAPFLLGTSNVLTGFLSDLGRINHTIDTHQINVLFTTPCVIEKLLRYQNTNMDSPPDHVFVTSEVLSLCQLERWQEKVPGNIINLFSTANHLLPLFDAKNSDMHSLGVPSSGNELRVVNLDGSETEIGKSGLLQFKNKKGAWETLPDYVQINENGRYQYLGRTSQIQSNINCLEIENLLLSTPDIEDCLVRFDKDSVLNIQVETKIGSEFTIDDLSSRIDFPANWCFVEKIPRTHDRRKFDYPTPVNG